MSGALFKRAALLFGLFALAHVAGLREYLPLLCGSPAPGNLPRGLQALFCVSYLMLWFAAVLVAPVLALAALLLRLFPSRPG